MSQNAPKAGTQIRLLVNSASEAVKVIREKYGEMARVLSVKQVEAGGLKRLVSGPKLEVIVELTGPVEKPAAAPAVAKAPAAPVAAPAATEEKGTAKAVRKPIDNLYSKNEAKAPAGDYFAQFSEKESSDENKRAATPASKASDDDAPLGSAANPVQRGTVEAVKRAISMLESIGFDRSLIERVRAEVDFRDIGTLPTMDLYSKICDWLRSRMPDTRDCELAPRRAFIGCSGVGKTSALCKMLSSEVFVKGLTPSVLKVDSQLPNPSDGLEVFCDIMGVGLARSAAEVQVASEERPLLVDMPGYRLDDADSIEACRENLDALGIDERILVVNAAYEAELIADMMAAGESIGATKVVFTHLEETRRAGKLWKFLLSGRLQPLFFSEGPNPAGEYTMQTYSYLLERSFPNGRELAASAKRTGKPATASAREASVES